jgi:hypothetical protein
VTEETDLVYSRNVADELLKHGTKYERLAALVYKVVDEENTVIHDLKLRGPGKRAEHQIDVTVSRRGQEQQQRMIVECRDKNDGNKIGQGAVRDFATVVRSLNAKGVMLATTGFTRGAEDVAADEGIELGTLTAFSDEDWEGRVKQVKIVARMQLPTQIHATLRSSNPGEQISFDGAVPGETIIRTPTEALDLATVVREALGTVTIDESGPVEIEREFAGGTVIELDSGDLPIGSVVLGAHMTIHETEIAVGPPGVPELILRSLDGMFDRVIFDRDIKRFVIRPDGTVEPRSTGSVNQ